MLYACSIPSELHVLNLSFDFFFLCVCEGEGAIKDGKKVPSVQVFTELRFSRNWMILFMVLCCHLLDEPRIHKIWTARIPQNASMCKGFNAIDMSCPQNNFKWYFIFEITSSSFS